MDAPPIRFLLPSERGYVVVDDSAATLPMRLNRRPSERDSDIVLTYGEYFRAVAGVLAKNEFQPFVRAMRAQLEKEIALADMERISIFAEKHGSDYHPARIEVELAGDRTVFVMNVAATERGRNRLLREFDVLKLLHQKYGYPYLPRAYFQDAVACGRGPDDEATISLVMFLGEWFQGYHEFHVTGEGNDGELPIILWDAEEGNRFISKKSALQVYGEAARIMTLYYDLDTFEQIFPWHHAAGDFIVRDVGEALKVRLITARQYESMLDPGEGVPQEEGLLFFFLNLSLRMRLDRLDGTGEVAWADRACVAATVEGFLDGLRVQEQEGRAPAGIREAFFSHCDALGGEGISERAQALVGACDPRAPDIPVMKEHRIQHMVELLSEVKRASHSFQ